jgi:Tol biopolymer transport system component
MKTLKLFAVFAILAAFSYSFINNFTAINNSGNSNEDTLIYEGEKHFKNMKMLTNGGENAECYFSFDGTKFIFQSSRDGRKCDQIYTMNIDGSDVKMVSNGKGATTCSYFYPDGKHILYASTYLGGDDCPPKPDFSQGYVWAMFDTYDIFKADADGSNIVPLTNQKGYDAEATISPKGDKIIFTSLRDGDIDLYSMDLDGNNVTRLTNEPGYDGGAYYSNDGTKIVYRATRPKTEQELKEFKELVKNGLVKPTTLEIYVMDADGSNNVQVTSNGAANFAPFFFPDGKRIVFCSNLADPKGRNFDLYAVNIDGTGLERITYNETFDGFPMFSPDGKKFVFCSNRFNAKQGETNVFICDWVE